MVNNKEGIAIIGMDCRYPGASDTHEFWNNIISLRQQFREIPKKRLNLDYYGTENKQDVDLTYSKKAAVLTNYNFDRIKYRISKSVYETTDLAHWIALEVANGALEDAGFAHGEGIDKKKVAVIIGNSLNGEFSRANLMRLRWPYVYKVIYSTLLKFNYEEEQILNILKETEEIYKFPFPEPNEETLAGGLSNTIAGRICNYFDFNGGGYTIDGACSSSLLALTNGCDVLLNQDMEMVIVGGVDLSIDPFELVGFARTGALASEEMRVFEANAQGFWPGEGCGMVILMKESEAIKRKLNIYSVIRGCGISSDGSGGLTRPKVETQQLAIERAYKKTTYNVADISMFEAHGTGTIIGDEVELKSLINCLKNNKKPAVIGSIKQLIGHTKAASGIAGIIKTSLALKNRVIPPSRNNSVPHLLLKENAQALYLSETPVFWKSKETMKAGVSSFGFGGINVHVTLEEALNQHSNTDKHSIDNLHNSVRDYEIFPITARTTKELLCNIEKMITVSREISRAEFIDLSSTLSKNHKENYLYRAAIVAATPDSLIINLVKLKDAVSKGETIYIEIESGIYFSSEGEKKKAFVFTGQGAPVYKDSGKFKMWESYFSNINFSKELEETFNQVSETDVLDTSLSQPYIVMRTLQALQLVEKFGVTADIGIGYSLGEISSMVWSGVLSIEKALEISSLRGSVMSKYGDKGGAMLAINCDKIFLEKIMRDKDLFITSYNGNNNYVVGGKNGNILELEKLAFSESIPNTRLKVHHAFHTPMMDLAAKKFKKEIGNYEFKKGEKKIASTLTGDFFDKVYCSQYLSDQIKNPVRFSDAVEKVKRQVEFFFELGPGKQLTKILEADKAKVIGIDFSSSSIKGFLEILAAAFISGDTINFSMLSQNRFYKDLTIDSWKLDVLENPCETDMGEGIVYKTEKEPDIWSQKDKFQKIEEEIILDQSVEKINRFLIRTISEKIEIPENIISENDLLMSKLHINSLAITEIISIATKTFNKTHAVFSEATILANTDVSISKIAHFIYEGEGLKEGSSFNIDFQKLIPWTHVFVKELVNVSLKAGAFNETKGSVYCRGISIPQIEKLKNKLKRIGTISIFFYTKYSTNYLNDFLVFLKDKNIERSKIIALIEIHDQSHENTSQEYDLKPVLRSFQQEHRASIATSIEIEDFNSNLSEIIFNELSTLSVYRESVYKKGVRKEPRFAVFFPEKQELKNEIQQGDVILSTGAGKGITYESIKKIAIETQARVAILGRASREQDKRLSENLEKLEKEGIMVRYYQADVTDFTRISDVVDDITKEWGDIKVVLHGAGINIPKKIEQLSIEDFNKTTNIKVQGLKNILQIINKDKLKLLIAYGSIISEIGMHGNADYAWANNQLALLVNKFHKTHKKCKCLTIEWSVWDEIGMGASLNSLEFLKQQNIWPILPADAVEILKSLISNTKINEGNRFIVSSRIGELPTFRYSKKRLPIGRFLTNILHHTPGIEVISEVNINLQDDVYLKNHVFEGQHVFPTVMILEGAAQISTILVSEIKQYKFKNVKINKPIFIPKDKSNIIRFIATRRSETQINFIVQSEDSNFEVNCFEFIVCIQEDFIEDFKIKRNHPIKININKFYDDLLFHQGSFRRIKSFHKINSLSSSAYAESNQDDTWYGEYISEQKNLGDPGLNDAAIHCHQICRPSQKLLPISVDEIIFNLDDLGEQFYIHTEEIEEIGDNTHINVYISNKGGKVKMMWKNLVLKQVRGIQFSGEWDANLLVPHLEYLIKHKFNKTYKGQISLDKISNVINELQKGENQQSFKEGNFVLSFQREQTTLMR